ncbi:MAG: hypothetical protein JWO47_628 [Candidatus Saccharibacteria bacterium]|nr:hypothetical protein [Candidatus Saccharibacteria bacterium]
MSNYLADLLGATEPLFSMAVKQLETASGLPGADVRLIAEIVGKIHLKSKELGLDPNDTTGEELYHALISKVRLHDEHLAKQIGGKDPSDVQAMLPLIKKAVDAYEMPRSAWVLKRSVAKRMLHDMPPPSIMKHLGYSSIDSMLKRENLFEVYGALRFAETPAWLVKFDKTYKSLTPSDFETRDIEILQMDKKRWGDIAEDFVRKKRHNITHLKELGVILMLPTNLEKLPGITLTAMPLLFHYVNEIRLYSSFFKLQQVKPHFGKIIAETLVADIGSAAVMAGSHVHWRVIQRYYGKLKHEYHPEIFEPHVQPEDLHWRKAEEYLYDIDPELGFWRDLDYVALLAGKNPISFNLLDCSMSYSTGANYDQRLFFHMRESLWNELFIRYMGQANLASQVLKQLDNNMIAPERLTV